MGSVFVSIQTLEVHGVLGWSVTMVDTKMQAFVNRRRLKRKKLDVGCVCVSEYVGVGAHLSYRVFPDVNSRTKTIGPMTSKRTGQ